MAGDFDTSDEDYAADHAPRYPLATLTRRQIREILEASKVANPLHPRPEVEDAPRDPQPARLSGEVL